jgi:hypothetical protein
VALDGNNESMILFNPFFFVYLVLHKFHGRRDIVLKLNDIITNIDQANDTVADNSSEGCLCQPTVE